MANEKVTITKLDSIVDHIDKARGEIAVRAYELFMGNGSSAHSERDHWLTAEHQLFWRPPIDVIQKDNVYEVAIAVPGIDPRDIEIAVAPNALLIHSQSGHRHSGGEIVRCDFAGGRLFREIDLPKAIHADSVRVDVRAGFLYLKAEISEEIKSEPQRRKGRKLKSASV